jgi:hypothetical protein
MTVVPISVLTLDPAALVDIGEGGLKIASNGTTEQRLRQALIDGRATGNWKATTGLTSSTAAATTGKGVGYAWQPDGSVVVRYTLYGDAQLDGKSDFDDILALFPFYQAAGTYRWQEGDFTYDGKVDFDDILALFPNYGSNALFGGNGLGVGGGSGAGLGGGGGGSGDTAWLNGFGGSGTGETDAPATDGTADPAATETAEMGPLPPPDMPGRPPITLVRNGNTTSPGDSIASSDASATSLAFAAIAAEQDEREKSDRKRDWLTVTDGR